MDTTQMTPETPVQQPRQEVWGDAPPMSAQQNNGAVRSAEEQRSAAGTRPRQEEDVSRREEAPRKRRPQASKAAPAKKQAVKKAAPRKKVKKQEEVDVPDRKRSYGSTKKKKSAVSVVSSLLKPDPEKQTKKKSGKSDRPKQPTPAVIYTQPAAFNRNRLLVQLATVVAVVASLVMGLSVFFKVEHITVSGAQVYEGWDIKEASGLVEGQSNLLTFSRARARAQIRSELPYIDTVRFGIKLPDTVNIIVKEDSVAYAIKDENQSWWMMTSNGRVVESTDNSQASNNTQVLGVRLYQPIADERGVALENTTEETYEGGETVPITVTGAQRLTCALQILKALEANGVVGEIASVDVSRLEEITLWYGSRYQVNLGDSTNIDYKIACMKDAILQMSDWQSGILDISFTVWPTQVGFTPFG